MEDILWSEYLQQLSAVAKQRYKEKVFRGGFLSDSYCISDSEWEKSPELKCRKCRNHIIIITYYNHLLIELFKLYTCMNLKKKSISRYD